MDTAAEELRIQCKDKPFIRYSCAQAAAVAGTAGSTTASIADELYCIEIRHHAKQLLQANSDITWLWGDHESVLKGAASAAAAAMQLAHDAVRNVSAEVKVHVKPGGSHSFSSTSDMQVALGDGRA